ncbi:protein eyes shut isoform X2 [Venturia canescens]|uniref:protein eyes shut isoform X2 n=1 Tax=Venturia canescens TaxID=32260 RepID=UPI001C9CB52B|nr:protein eyes shut isoform X2 [Venturia canescens]
MMRSYKISCWQQGFIVIVVTVAIHLSSGLQNCTGEPCMYGICMDNANGSYACYCIDGYTGINCEINWDDCWSNPCYNGGTCNDAVASYNCTCADSFIGVNCEQKYSECMNQPCLNNGTCIDYNGFMCQCLEGYSGDYCEIDASVCNNTICKNAGECVEGPGYSFYCKCTEGWTGLFCDDDIDECVTSPCQNGGLCLNVPATYTCACLFGFTGKNCDKAIVPCVENPCENEAMCLLEDSQPVCYCVPDYHGQLCEQRYDDCESKFARCENGGTCVDGINNFTCSCPLEYSGEMCHEYNPTTTIIASTAAVNATMKTVPLPTMIYLTSQETLKSSPSTRFYSDMTTSSNVDPDEEFSTTKSIELKSTTLSPPKNTSFVDARSDIDSIQSETLSTAPIMEHALDSTTARVIYLTALTSVTSSSPTETSLERDSTKFSGSSISHGISDSTTEFETKSSITPEPMVPRDTSTVFQPETPFEPSITTEFPATSSSPKISSKTYSPSGETRDDRVFTFLTSAMTTEVDREDSESVDVPWKSSSSATTSSDESTGFVDENMDDVTTMEVIDLSNDTMDNFSTRFFLVTPSTKVPKDLEPREETSHDSRTTTQSSRYDCSQEECLIANCPQNSTQCDCQSRDKCKDGPSIENAAFNGKSYLRQQVNIDADGSLRIFIRLKTKSKSGVLVHAFFDDERYVLLYMEGGQLKFQFSCGLQTMLLGEIDSPINNGFDVDVEMRFQYLIGTDDIGKCSARLLVNDTMAMSGEQILSSHESTPRQVRIHLGGIPQAFSHYFPRIAMGFIGCMSLLKVNNAPRHFIHDSTETFQIEECTSFLCLLNPCRNFGSCHDINGQVYCKCIAGYSGTVCERSACDDNPCYLGATCISSPGTGFICVCPLGMHGLLCEEESAIVQPSFSVFIPGFSSYAAYGLTNAIKDGMELRMRLVPHSLDQISLIAFIGQTGTNRDVSDHFSLTYVRGYIMLTWDLGSGVRRIFTKSPLRTRAHRPHTLRVGRRGREAWLSVDGLGNITGEAAGTMTQLDVSPILYIGGHKSRNFETLPHDLPLHTGFYGCIFDIELRTDDTVFPITKSSPATGRGVGECHRNECSHNACKNGALCLNHGPTYSCVCMKEWEGADCSVPAVTCSSSTPYMCQKADRSP